MIGSVGFPELILILIVALLVFGPEKLPEVIKSTVKTVRAIKKEMADVRKTIEDEIGDITEEVDDVKKNIIVAGDIVNDSEESEEIKGSIENNSDDNKEEGVDGREEGEKKQ